jgi:hypothetical protein
MSEEVTNETEVQETGSEDKNWKAIREEMNLHSIKSKNEMNCLNK